MQVSTNLVLDLQRPNINAIVHAKQNDKASRSVVAKLMSGESAFMPPNGANYMIRYGKSDGTGGMYDKIEDGETAAVTVSQNTATIRLVEQALTAPGPVVMELNIYDSTGAKLTTFSWIVFVEESAFSDEEIVSTNYFNILTEEIALAVQAGNVAQQALDTVPEAAQTATQALADIQALAATIVGNVGIDDTATRTTTTWSSQKIDGELGELRDDLTAITDKEIEWKPITYGDDGVDMIGGSVKENGDTSIHTPENHNTISYVVSEKCDVYFTATSSAGYAGIYPSGSIDDKTGFVWMSKTGEGFPTAESPLSVNAGTLIRVSNKTAPDSGKYATIFIAVTGAVSLRDNLPLTVTMEAQVREMIPKLPKPTYDFDSIGTVIGINHMGYHVSAPSNTLPAFRLSKQHGFSMIECDVRFTADNIPVLMHNETINETCCNAADGTAIAGTIGVIDKTYAELQQYDACTPGKWVTYKGTKIPRLEDVYALCREVGLGVDLDCKAVSGEDQFEILFKLAKSYHIDRNVIYSFSSIGAAEQCAKLNDEAFVAEYESTLPTQYITRLKALLSGKNRIAQFGYSADPSAVEQFIAAGLDVGLVITSNSYTDDDVKGIIASMDKRIGYVTANKINATEYLREANIGDENGLVG